MKKIYNDNYIDINLARQKMGMVFQQFNLFNNKTVKENIMLAPVKTRMDKINKAKLSNALTKVMNVFRKEKAPLIEITETKKSIIAEAEKKARKIEKDKAQREARAKARAEHEAKKSES